MSFTIIPKYKKFLLDIIIYLIETLNQIDINVLILKSGISSKYYHNTFYNTNPLNRGLTDIRGSTVTKINP